MKSKASSRFWKLYHQLPESIRQLADKNYKLWQSNHRHPSIGFKKLKGGKERFSVRVGDHYRAIGELAGDEVVWVWIGSHEEYNKIVDR
jgi:mRNA-degrading endonuclease RelE of RelBE toxin-antitoxin system